MPSLLLKAKIKKPKLLRSNPLRKSLIISGSDPNTTVDDEYIIPVDRRRHKFDVLRDEIDNTELSDEIKFRLFLIRVKALQKHREVYYNNVS